MKTRIARRQFVRHLAWGGTGLMILPSARSARSAPANERLHLGIIGVGGRGTALLTQALRLEDVTVTAICDLDSKRLDQALNLVEKARGKRPAAYPVGPTDYRRLLGRGDVDAVIIATPMQAHGVMAVDALVARKHVFSEVAAAMTLEECWELVRSAEASGRVYMLGENCCYYRQNLMVRRMALAGVFGPMTYAECGYVHDCRAYVFHPDGSLTWRGELARDHIGNLYPTHALGPVCQWLGIHRGDRLTSLVASTSAQKGLDHYVRQKFAPDHPAARTRFSVGDTTTVLLRTAKGAVIDLRYDTCSARPHPSTTYFTLQGTTASYRDDGSSQQIWIEGQTPGYTWEPLERHASAHEHPLWTRHHQAAAPAGHSGADYLVLAEFVAAVRDNLTSPIDAYDAAAWSAIIPLSAASLRAGGAPQEVPDFTRGMWENRGGG